MTDAEGADLVRQELDGNDLPFATVVIVVVAAFLSTWGRIGPWADRLPGDLGDSRFNMVVLEHIHLWTRGRVGLFDGLFFWPLDDVILYSDHHLGSSWAYLVPRWFGMGISGSFMVWYLAGVLLSGVAAYAVARRWWFGPSTSIVIAAVFLLAFPVTTQAGHAQLMHRWYIPWACLGAVRFSVALLSERVVLFRRGRALSGWLAAGFLCSPGLALLTGLVALVAVGTSLGLLLTCDGDERERAARYLAGRDSSTVSARSAVGGLIGDWRRAKPWVGASRSAIARWVGWCAVVGTAGWVGLAYRSHASRFGLTRSSTETLFYSPTLRSLVTSTGSRWWGWMGHDASQPGVGEHALLFGVVVLALAVAGLRSGAPQGRLARLSMAIVVVGALLVVKVGEFSVFVWLAKWVPALDSIRTPGRLALVLAFPVAAACGAGLQRIRVTRSGWLSLAALLVLFLELGSQSLPSAASIEFSTGAEVHEAELRDVAAPLEIDAFLLLDARAVPWWVTDTEAMLAAYRAGIPTVNGYSGYNPYYPGNLMTCDDAKLWLRDQPELAAFRVYVMGANCGVITPG